MNVSAQHVSDLKLDAGSWELRVDLAAAHRLAVMHGFSEGIFNHFTALLPGSNDRFLTLPFGLHWSEAAASTLLEADFNGNVVRGSGEVERTAYCIHMPVHRARPDAPCVFHTHMPFASALTRLEDPCLKAIGQTEVGFLNDIAYDRDYSGLARGPEEGERMAKILGSKNILFLANHGVLVLGRTVAEAYDRLYYLERACQAQVYAMWTGMPLKTIPEEILERTRQQFANSATYGGLPHYELHFRALKRILSGKTDRNFDE